MADTRTLATLLAFFAGLAVCFWRVSQGDRWHIVLCGIAAAVWGGLLVFNPTLRGSGFVMTAAAFLAISLGQYRRRQPR